MTELDSPSSSPVALDSRTFTIALGRNISSFALGWNILIAFFSLFAVFSGVVAVTMAVIMIVRVSCAAVHLRVPGFADQFSAGEIRNEALFTFRSKLIHFAQPDGLRSRANIFINENVGILQLR